MPFYLKYTIGSNNPFAGEGTRSFYGPFETPQEAKRLGDINTQDNNWADFEVIDEDTKQSLSDWPVEVPKGSVVPRVPTPVAQTPITPTRSLSEPEIIGGYKVLYNQQGNRVEVAPADEQEARTRGYVFASPDSTGDDRLDAALDNMQAMFDKMTSLGQMINPNVQITPEKLAEFTTIASKEIDPYYSDQLKIAREQLLRDAGYSTEQILAKEQELASQYSRDIRTIASNAEEQGFTLSGQRQLQEQQLADAYQSQIESGRRDLAYQQGTKARSFAQSFGSNQQIPTIQNAPRALPGEYSLQPQQGVSPLYEINPDVYDSLKGEKEFEQEAVKRRRIAEQKSDYITDVLAGRQRTLEL